MYVGKKKRTLPPKPPRHTSTWFLLRDAKNLCSERGNAVFGSDFVLKLFSHFGSETQNKKYCLGLENLFSPCRNIYVLGKRFISV